MTNIAMENPPIMLNNQRVYRYESWIISISKYLWYV